MITYPLGLADATAESVETIFTRFAELQSAWAERFAWLIAEAKEGEEYPDGEDGEEPSTDCKQDSDVIIKA